MRTMTADRSVGVLLAGGLARRMGGDKPLRLLAGKPLLAHAAARLAPQCAGLAINANGDPAGFSAFGCPVVADSVAHHPGPLAGVLAGLDWAAAQGAAWLVSAPADCPFLPDDLVVRLMHARTVATRIVVATSGNADHPTVALWDVALNDELRGALTNGLRRVRDFIAHYPAARADWPATPVDPFFNVNTPDDLAKAEAVMAADRP